MTKEDIKKYLENKSSNYSLSEYDLNDKVEEFADFYNYIQRQVKNNAHKPVLAPDCYKDDYLKWLNKYFIKVDKVFEYRRANKHDYFTKEQLHKRYEIAMLESPFK